jgi:hypothetical protein
MQALREALAANLSSIKNVQVSAYMLVNPTPPAIHVIPGPTQYHLTMGKSSMDEWWEFTIQAFVAATNDIGSQKLLDSMLASDGDRSVKAAIESDTTLGGACDDLIVTQRTGYQIFVPDGRGTVLGAEWTVRVLT